MDFTVKWTHRARNTLREIIEHISADNESAAEDLRARILAKTALLKTTPRIGQSCDVEPGREVRQLVQGSYRIFYEVDEDRQQVLILIIWHAARRDPKL